VRPRISSDLCSIIAGAQAGNPSAIQKLYDQYADPVRRYCYARLGDFEAAQDCTQEVFLCLWKGIKNFEYQGERSFPAWLYTIAHHVLVSYLRKRRRAHQVALTPELGITDTQHTDINDIICERILLREAMRRLTLEQQHVIALKFFGGLPTLEIAAVLGRSEGAVKALQHRALSRLHNLLAKERPGRSSHLRVQEIAEASFNEQVTSVETSFS
jgi:RNA polymerase sigma-70 factor (ECF subfamily)